MTALGAPLAATFLAGLLTVSCAAHAMRPPSAIQRKASEHLEIKVLERSLVGEKAEVRAEVLTVLQAATAKVGDIILIRWEVSPKANEDFCASQCQGQRVPAQCRLCGLDEMPGHWEMPDPPDLGAVVPAHLSVYCRSEGGHRIYTLGADEYSFAPLDDSKILARAHFSECKEEWGE